jgi:hypothetical protein
VILFHTDPTFDLCRGGRGHAALRFGLATPMAGGVSGGQKFSGSIATILNN